MQTLAAVEAAQKINIKTINILWRYVIVKTSQCECVLIDDVYLCIFVRIAILLRKYIHGITWMHHCFMALKLGSDSDKIGSGVHG